MKRRFAAGVLFLCLAVSLADAQYYYNQAASFNGSTSYISVPNSPVLNPTTAITIELWVYPTAYNQAGSGLVTKNYLTSYSLGYDGYGRVIFYPRGGGQYLLSRAATQIPLNTWTHLAATYDGTTTRIIINGFQDTSTTAFTGPIGTNTDDLLIGAELNGSLSIDFQGHMDEVRMWSVARDANAIRFDRFIPLAMTNPNVDSRYTGLLHAWRMNGNTLDEGGFISNNGAPHNISYWDLRQKQVNYLDYNNSLMLDTFDSYCVAAPNMAFNATTAITLEAWASIDPPPDTSFEAIVVKGGETSWDYGLFASPIGPPGSTDGFRIYFAVNYGDTVASPVVPAGRWTHVAATYNSTTRSAVIYVNGDSVAGRVFATAGLIPNDPDSLFIGDFRPSQRKYQFSGQIDEVRIWKNVVRTADQIRVNMFNNLGFASVPSPGSSLTAYTFDGRNTNEMIQWVGTPVIDFKGGARMTSAHQQLGGELNSPILRDDASEFGGPTYAISRRQLDIPGSNPSGVVDSVHVSAPGNSTNVRMFLLLSYPTVGDLQITLIGPTGVSATLFRQGEGGGNRDIMTIFTDSADSTGGDGSPSGFQGPFSPFLKPVTPLHAFVGQTRQGWWKLKVVDSRTFIRGVVYGWGVQTSPLTGIQETAEAPREFELKQNYPNPFNPTTTIKFTIPKEVDVNLNVYNILGQLVSTLVSGHMTAGSYSIPLNLSTYASGTYFYRITAGSFVETKKMLVVK